MHLQQKIDKRTAKLIVKWYNKNKYNFEGWGFHKAYIEKDRLVIRYDIKGRKNYGQRSDYEYGTQLGTIIYDMWDKFSLHQKFGKWTKMEDACRDINKSMIEMGYSGWRKFLK